MLKRFLAVLFIVILFVMGCSTRETANTTEEETLENPPSSKTMQIDEVPLLLRKPEQWGNAPNFTAVRLGGDEFKLSSLKGKVILLNFWSVGCSVCKMQIPVLVELYKKYRTEGLEIVGVYLDRESVAKTYAEMMRMDYILVFANQEIMSKYGRNIRFIPVTFIIDSEGNIVEKHVGYITKSKFEEEIKELLKKTEETQ
jgi:peroxiredoxin